jgi:hypothetical protein
MKISVKAIGTFCNTWPNLVIEINNQKIYDGLLEGAQDIELYHDDLLKKGNMFVIGMNNKSFGKNRIWDTKSENNKIIEDKSIKIQSLKLEGVECKDLFGNKFHVRRVDKQPSYFPDQVEAVDTMNYNGYFCFGFDLPLYNFLINKKFKKATKKISYFSNYTKVFHYEHEEKIIREIEKNLKEIDEKFSDKRSKIRNS